METTVKNILKSFKMNEATISTILGGLVVIVVGILLWNYFKTTAPTPQISEEAATQKSGEVEVVEESEGQLVPKDLPTTHTVASGETLWSISEKYFGNGYNWVDIASENNLTNADLIAAGQTLTIPKAALRYTKEVTAVASGETAADSLLSATSYTVQRGDHLWSIALRAYGDGYKWSGIYEANKEKIANPDEIEIGMELTLPR